MFHCVPLEYTFWKPQLINAFETIPKITHSAIHVFKTLSQMCTCIYNIVYELQVSV